MKEYIKPNTNLVDIETLPLLGVDSYGNPGDSDTGDPLTKGEGEWIDEDDGFGW